MKNIIWKNVLEYAKYVSMLLFLAGIYFSCVKEKNADEGCEDCLCIFDFTHEKSASIIGKWKLEKMRVHSRLGIFSRLRRYFIIHPAESLPYR